MLGTYFPRRFGDLLHKCTSAFRYVLDVGIIDFPFDDFEPCTALNLGFDIGNLRSGLQVDGNHVIVMPANDPTPAPGSQRDYGNVTQAKCLANVGECPPRLHCTSAKLTSNGIRADSADSMSFFVEYPIAAYTSNSSKWSLCAHSSTSS